MPARKSGTYKRMKARDPKSAVRASEMKRNAKDPKSVVRSSEMRRPRKKR